MTKNSDQKKIPQENTVERPPVIVVMGHVDHGKSTILDYIRETNVVEGESGGITQHISSYEVEHKSESGDTKKITFLDTPGHAAFSAIRARGASAADIAILVVSSEDGVKPQTIEAIECIKKAKIPFIVAINKIDLEPNTEKTKQNLAENEIYLEGYGGDVPIVQVSAKTGEGINELLDTILLVSEVEELTGEPSKKAEGVIVEGHVNPKSGISASLILRNGTLKKSDFIVAGRACAPVRIIEDFLGRKIDSATFSSPVSIVGWSDIPTVGSEIEIYENKKDAEGAILKSAQDDKTSKQDECAECTLPLIIKADTMGSLDAIIQEINKIEHEKMKIAVVKADVGQVTEEDVKVACSNEKSVVIGFNSTIEKNAESLADRSDVNIKTFNIIYKLTEWLEEYLPQISPKEDVKEETGVVKILKVFSATKKNQVIGGKVESGKIKKGDKVSIKRRENEIGSGVIKVLQKQKAEADSVSEGEETGIMIETKIEIAPGDSLASFHIVKK